MNKFYFVVFIFLSDDGIGVRCIILSVYYIKLLVNDEKYYYVFERLFFKKVSYIWMLACKFIVNVYNEKKCIFYLFFLGEKFFI